MDSLYLGRSGSHSSPRRRSSRRGRAGRSSAPGSPGLSDTSPGSCGQTGLPGRLEKEAWSALTHHSSMQLLLVCGTELARVPQALYHHLEETWDPCGWSTLGPETENTEGGEALGVNMAFLDTVLRSRGAREPPHMPWA